MNKPVTLLLGTMALTVALLGPALAAEPQSERGFSLPIGVTGPVTAVVDRQHTVPRLPIVGADSAAAPTSAVQAPAVALKPDGVVTVSQ